MTTFKNLILRATYIVAWSIITLLLFGCSNIKTQNVSDIRDLITDTISLPLNIEERIYFWNIKNIEGTDEVVSYLKDNNFTLYQYSIPKERIIDSISLLKYKPLFVDYAFQGLDTLIILLTNYQLMLFTEGREKTYDLKSLMLENVDSFAYPGMKRDQIYIKNNIITFNAATSRPRFNFSKPFSDEILFNYVVQCELTTDSIRYFNKYNPYDPDILINGYYEDRMIRFPSLNTLVYYYDFQNIIHKIDLDKDDTTSVQLFPSSYNWTPSIPLNYDSSQNHAYLFNYIFSRNNITLHLFNSYKNEWLFFMRKPIDYIKKDGSYTQGQDHTFTLFILDTNLIQKKEILINPNTSEHILESFITSKGLYLPIAKEFQNLDKDETLYYRINLD